MKRVGIVDIGSNAIRLLVAEGDSYQDSKVLAEERFSLRLGEDAFHQGRLRDETRWQFYQAMLEVRLICEQHLVKRIHAVATSALRNTRNSARILKDVKQISGIQIEIISGAKEASILKKATAKALPHLSQHGLAMDVGGGSVEFSNSKFSLSLPLGTVRMLENCAGRSYEDFALKLRPELLRFQSQYAPGQTYRHLLGTGGNIRSMARLCYRLHLSPSKIRFSLSAAQHVSSRLFDMTYRERREKLKLDPDRADVILPAACLLIETCRIFHIQNIFAPNVGLKNGLLLNALDK